MRDVSVVGDHVTALIEASTPDAWIAQVLDLDLVSRSAHTISGNFSRVAATSRTLLAASDGGLYVLGDELREIAHEPADFAASSHMVVALAGGALQWFDAEGHTLGSQRLAATAIAVDRVEPGWLIATADEVLHLTGPGAAPRHLVHLLAPATKIRRSRTGVHARIDWKLVSIYGDDIELRGPLDANSWHPVDFDAGPEGLFGCGGGGPTRLCD